jgi:hypothetical protein
LGLFQGRKKNLRQMTKPHQISRLSYLLSPIFHLPISLSRSIVLIRGQSRQIAPKKIKPMFTSAFHLFRVCPAPSARNVHRGHADLTVPFPLSTFHFFPSSRFERIRGQSNPIEPKKMKPSKPLSRAG